MNYTPVTCSDHLLILITIHWCGRYFLFRVCYQCSRLSQAYTVMNTKCCTTCTSLLQPFIIAETLLQSIWDGTVNSLKCGFDQTWALLYYLSSINTYKHLSNCFSRCLLISPQAADVVTFGSDLMSAYK